MAADSLPERIHDSLFIPRTRVVWALTVAPFTLPTSRNFSNWMTALRQTIHIFGIDDISFSNNWGRKPIHSLLNLITHRRFPFLFMQRQMAYNNPQLNQRKERYLKRWPYERSRVELCRLSPRDGFLYCKQFENPRQPQRRKGRRKETRFSETGGGQKLLPSSPAIHHRITDADKTLRRLRITVKEKE